MKKLLLLFLFPILCTAQQTNQNYIKTVTYNQASIPSIHDPAPEQASVMVTYLDGLGRKLQQVAGKQATTGKDILTFFDYDPFGRPVREFLPYASEQSNLAYRSDLEQETFTFYNNEAYQYAQNPFSEKFLESSKIGKLLKQSAPGNDWAGSPNNNEDHTIRMVYGLNTASEVRYFMANAVWDAEAKMYVPTLFDQGNAYYFQQQLYKTVTKNENWVTGDGSDNTVEEFTDKNGRLVLKRAYESVKHDTYYVYDQFGNLTFVIPPLVDTAMGISQNLLDGLCYQYRYDRHNRLVEKKIPGKDWEFVVYNLVGQPVMTGPVASPFNQHDKGCLFTKYDAYGRICYTGYYMPEVLPTRMALQTNFDNLTNISETRTKSLVAAGDISTFYSNSVFPTSGIALLSVNYYDDYLYETTLPMPETVYGFSVATNPRGLQTASWERALGAPGSVGNWTYSGYDNVKFRPIWNGTHFYNDSYTMSDTEFDFTGKILQTQTVHWASGGGEQVIHDVYSYTAQQLPLRHTQQINSKPAELLYLNEYNALGQLTSKKVGGADTTGNVPYQKIDYRYNIRGWLTDINDRHNLEDVGFRDDLFAFHINYNSVEGEVSEVSPLYNGNISETFWKASSDVVMRSYGYRYDKLNRLLHAFYQKPGGIVEYPASYDEKLEYDMNGNIVTLRRNGNLDSDSGDYLGIDLLNYYYDPIKKNQLKGVSDLSNDLTGFMDGTNSGDDFDYDSFGNMTVDRNKGITSITYNHLNLPVKIEFGSTSTKIEYLYGAGGQKLKKKITVLGNVIVIDYYGSFHYRNGVLQFIRNPEGYVVYTPSNSSLELESPSTPESFNYVYHYTDHLGNIRLTYGIDPSVPEMGLKILEENHYYPFGLKHTNYNSGNEMYGRSNTDKVELKPGQQTRDGKVYNYKFQGQERQDELGLNWDSFKWRNYDYAIGRFMNIDPLTEEYNTWSPYAFSGNRVIDARELEGLEPHLLHDNLQDAARNFSQQYNGYSIENSVEVATQFYKTGDGKYSYNNPLQFSPGLADPSQSNDFLTGALPAGDAHTHGRETDMVVVQANVTSGGPLTGDKNPKAMGKLTLNDFGSGPNQYQVVNGANGPSGNDSQAAAHPNTTSPTFERSYLFTPSGLSYSGTLSKDGKSIDYQINYNLSKTNPSQADSKLNINNVPSNVMPTYIPLQGTINLSKP